MRGIISIKILAKIEEDLRRSSKRPNFVLSDYFDYGVVATIADEDFAAQRPFRCQEQLND